MPIRLKSLMVLDETAQELVRQAERATKHSHAGPGSMRAGAAALTAEGAIHPGALFSGPAGEAVVCAETGALAAAHAAAGQVIALALVAGPDVDDADGKDFSPRPCGGCRELLAVAGRRYGREIVVYLANRRLGRIELTTAGELLP